MSDDTMPEITAEDVAAAEAQLREIKASGTSEEKDAAAEAVASLRFLFRTAQGRDTHAFVAEDNTGEGA